MGGIVLLCRRPGAAGGSLRSGLGVEVIATEAADWANATKLRRVSRLEHPRLCCTKHFDNTNDNRPIAGGRTSEINTSFLVKSTTISQATL
jgi:hypothetical protein